MSQCSVQALEYPGTFSAPELSLREHLTPRMNPIDRDALMARIVIPANDLKAGGEGGKLKLDLVSQLFHRFILNVF